MAAEHAIHAAREAISAAHGSSSIPELPNLITALSHWQHHPAIAWLHRWENVVFSLLVSSVICLIAWCFARKPTLLPRRGQNILELLADGIDQFIQRVLGPDGRRHTPFIGTLFLFIWITNLSGLLPGMKSSTANLSLPIALALAVFGYVQWTRIRDVGLLAYLDHMAGSPRIPKTAAWLMPIMLVITAAVAVILLVLEALGEFIKPASLCLRLTFNIFAEDVLLAVLVGLGLAAGIALHLPIGLPVQLFAVPLVLIFSTVQALVFSLLATVYLSLVTPHHGEHHSHVPEA
ncbi:MAG: F0F1 ATP synthase subunit A [Candidatus Omnitrophica bacterium]|nr:F0F1 ATP synthase subunit A [Candidatus Omnitrophota bacterium]